jgi:hypothetical protein
MKRIALYTMLAAFGTTSLLACYNHVNKIACPSTYTNPNGVTCTLEVQGNDTYDDPNDDGSGNAGNKSVKDKVHGLRDCQYSCTGSADLTDSFGKVAYGDPCS